MGVVFPQVSHVCKVLSPPNRGMSHTFLVCVLYLKASSLPPAPSTVACFLAAGLLALQSILIGLMAYWLAGFVCSVNVLLHVSADMCAGSLVSAENSFQVHFLSNCDFRRVPEIVI